MLSATGIHKGFDGLGVLRGIDLGLFYKRRDYTSVVDGRHPIIAHAYLGDDVEGKDVFVSDDILSSGESVLDLARELKKRISLRKLNTRVYMFGEKLDN